MNWLVEARKTKGLSQKELANKLGVSDKTIWLWENEQTYPPLDMVRELIRILEIKECICRLNQPNKE